MDKRPHFRRWTRFSILTLLLVMLFIGGMLAGYRVGFDRGYAAGEVQRRQETPVAKAYDVADLVLPSPDASPDTADYSTLTDLITSSIIIDQCCTKRKRAYGGHPHSWSPVGKFAGVTRDTILEAKLVKPRRIEIVAKNVRLPESISSLSCLSEEAIGSSIICCLGWQFLSRRSLIATTSSTKWISLDAASTML